MLHTLLLLVFPLAILCQLDGPSYRNHPLQRRVQRVHRPAQTQWAVKIDSAQEEPAQEVVDNRSTDASLNSRKRLNLHQHGNLHEKRSRPLRQTPSTLSTVTVKVITSCVPTGTVQILPSPSGVQPDTTGSLHSSLETQGRPSTQPILTSSIPAISSTLTPSNSMFSRLQPSTATAAASENIFAAPIGTGAPPSPINSRQDHPVPRLGITGNPPISTNKFYANFFLGSQTAPTFTHPYSVAWAKGQGASGSWGLAISHIDARQRVYGPTGSNGAVSYYLNPVGIQSLVVSASELGSDTVLTTDEITAYSVRVNLKPNAAAVPAISFPLVQGTAFTTAVFDGATPLIQTGVFYRTVTQATKEAKPGVTKYKFTLEDGTLWILYAYHVKGNPLSLQVVNNGLAQASGPFYGIIQIAKDPGGGEVFYDRTCGAYPTSLELSGTAKGLRGSYTFNYTKAGMSGTTLGMWALPHHMSSFDDVTRRAAHYSLTLQTTTKGVATAILADSWTMEESYMPVSMGFAPWNSTVGTMTQLSDAAKALIRQKAQQEVSQNMTQQTNLNSMYFSGKALAKFAMIIYTINDLLGDESLAQTALDQLKVAFAQFAENRQQFPLVYESAWGGVVSSASYVTGNSGDDFGNTYYNDHHFHYGYHILTAAVIGYLDPAWITANKDYVNVLVRDVSNPSSQDKYFPVHRAFDWYHGHSWAHGLFETFDGKDQESSSEDVMHAYAIKMWGQVSGDANMVARGNLQLSILARALKEYYLYTQNNSVQPAQFIQNRVAGILFENKIDHTTYFGTNIEYIQGIHMLPLLPSTTLTRSADFVQQEWDEYFSNGRADTIVGGWRGILYGNYATLDPRGAYQFFSDPNFDPSWLDGGASLTWYLAYAAAMGGL